MLNMNKASPPSKLRQNGSKPCHNKLQSCSNSDVTTNSMKSNSFSTGKPITVQNNFMPVPTSQPPQSKCGGRGIIIKQLLEESKNNSCSIMRKQSMDYSNANIEKHFKQLQAEHKIKQNEKEKIDWKMKFN